MVLRHCTWNDCAGSKDGARGIDFARIDGSRSREGTKRKIVPAVIVPKVMILPTVIDGAWIDDAQGIDCARSDGAESKGDGVAHGKVGA